MYIGFAVLSLLRLQLIRYCDLHKLWVYFTLWSLSNTREIRQAKIYSALIGPHGQRDAYYWDEYQVSEVSVLEKAYDIIVTLLCWWALQILEDLSGTAIRANFYWNLPLYFSINGAMDI